MNTRSFRLTLVVLVLLGSSANGDEKLAFDKVVVQKAKDSGPDLLFVVLTEPKPDHDKLDELVVKYAAAALREAAAHKFDGTTKGVEKFKYKGNVVFIIRDSRDDRRGFATGFGIEQLREIVAATPEAGRKLAGRHAWSTRDVPDGK